MDFHERSTFNQTSPDSHFTHKMVISKPISNGRITLNNTSLKISEESKNYEIIEFSENEFSDYLKRYFDIVL